MPQTGNKSLLSSRHWRNMTQSMATAVCNATSAVYGRLRLEAVTRRVLPEHTRDALFQLFCDVRANTPKDRVFVVRHAQALQPRTFSGWLAMFAALLYGTSGLALTSIGLLGLMAATAFTSIFFAVIGGIMLASFVGVVATSLAFASVGLVAVSGSVATGAAAGYVTLNFWKSVFRSTGLIRQRVAQANSYTLEANLPSGRHQYKSPQQAQLPPSTPAYPAVAPGEASHDKLTTEPAQEPFKKATEGEDLSKAFDAPHFLSAQPINQDQSAIDSPFASAFQAKPKARGDLDRSPVHSSSFQSSSETTMKPDVAPKQATNDQDVNQISVKGSPPSLDKTADAEMSLFIDSATSGGSSGKPASSQKQASSNQDLNSIFARDATEGKSSAVPQSAAEKDGSAPAQVSLQQATSGQDLSKISDITSTKGAAASSGLSFFTSDTSATSPADTSANSPVGPSAEAATDTSEQPPTKPKQGAGGQPQGKDPKMIGSEDSSLEEGLDLLDDPEKAKDGFKLPRSSQKQAIDDRDVDTSADSAGEVKGSAFVPSTGVGLHTPDGTDGAKDADADSGSGEKPQHVDKANTAEQSQAEREISAPSQATSDDKDDDDDVYTLFRSSGIRDTSQAATGLSANASEGSAKRSGAMGQSSSDGRPERAQQSKHATLPQTQATNGQDFNSISDIGSKGDGEPSRSSAGLGQSSPHDSPDKLEAEEEPAYVGGTLTADHLQSERASIHQRQATNDQDINAIYGSGGTQTRRGEASSPSTGLNLFTSGEAPGKHERHEQRQEQPRSEDRGNRAEPDQSEPAHLHQGQATIDQDVNASFSERAPSQAQDSRNFSSYISDTAQQQDYTKGQNQALRELHIGGPEPDSRGGSRSFPGESPVFQHAGGDEGFNEEQGRADSQKGPIISEPSSSPTFASDSGNGSDDQGRFFEHSGAPTGQGAFSKAPSGALPPGSHSRRRDGPGVPDLNFHSSLGSGGEQKGRGNRQNLQQNIFQNDEFPGFGQPGRHDIGLQSNFTGPSGPMGSMGPRGQSSRPY